MAIATDDGEDTFSEGDDAGGSDDGDVQLSVTMTMMACRRRR